jgi:hypothetical protein
MQPVEHADLPQGPGDAEVLVDWPDMTGVLITLKVFSSFFEPHSGQSGFWLELCRKISTWAWQLLQSYS